LDPLGTVFIPLFLLFTSGIFIGWAKPVPYNPYNLTDRRYGSLKVAAAGPLTNLFIAVVLGIVLRVFVGVFDSSIFVSGVFPQLVALIVYINIFLALFNLIPVPPLDGFKIFTDLFPRSGAYLYQVGYFGIFLAIAVAFFVLSPLAQSLFWLITGQNFFF
jgi:Zn-dependent protease